MKQDLQNRTMQSAGLALLIEAGLIVALGYGVTVIHHEQPHQVSVITLTTPPEPKPEPKPEPLPKPKIIPPKKVEPKPVVHKMVTPPPPRPIPKSVVEKPTPVATPTATTEPPPPPAPPPPPPPPPTPTAPDPAVVNDYALKVNAAIQAAINCPDGVVINKDSKVGYTLHGTSLSNVHIVSSSGVPAADSVALRAVQNASIPEPPADLKNLTRQYRTNVTVDCN